MNLAFFVVAASLVVLAIGLSWYFSREARIKRALAAVAVRPIAELRPGEDARVTGRILTTETVDAPMSGRQCVYFYAQIEERRSSGKSHRWVTVAREEGGCAYVITDGTGEIYVDPFGATSVVVKDEHGESGTFDDPTPEETAFLERHNVSATALGGLVNQTLRYSVGVFEVAEEVTVLGRVVSEGGKLWLRAPPEGALYMSDDPSVTAR